MSKCMDFKNGTPLTTKDFLHWNIGLEFGIPEEKGD